jgi:hypothetical protein
MFHATVYSLPRPGEIRGIEILWNVGDRSPLTFAALMIGHHVSIVIGEEHLGRLLVAW